MYIAIGIVVALLPLLSIINIARHRRIVRKICCMPFTEKLEQLNEFVGPFGFEYLYQADIFSSTEDCPQRDFGYMRLFDRFASMFNMVFDCEPVYFNYCNKTWMIEFWKGQYGINTGAEIGIYCADKLVQPERLSSTRFRCVSNEELLYMSMELKQNDKTLFSTSGCHWWLTGFVMGKFTKPKELTLDISICFPNEEMLCAFAEALQNLGYSDVCICDLTISFSFTVPHTCQPRRMFRIRCWFAGLQNRFFCRLYKRFTRPFLQTIDRMLLIKAYIPFSFRRMSTIRSSKKYSRRCYR